MAFHGRNAQGPGVVVLREFKGGKIIQTHHLARQTARFRISPRDNLAGPALKIELFSEIGARSAEC
jgi:hypothetical protein